MMYLVIFENYLFSRDLVKALNSNALNDISSKSSINSSGKSFVSSNNKLKLIFKILSIPAFLVAALFFLYCVIPAQGVDLAVVGKKYITPGNLEDFVIKAKGKGKYFYKESVAKDFYDRVEVGDVIVVHPTMFFKEAKSLEFVQDGAVIAKSGGNYFYFSIICGLAFLIPLLLFRSEEY